MDLKKYSYLIFIICYLLSGCSAEKKQVLEKPNIIFIISDDQAYSDYGFMGHKFIETPHLDTLAKESLTFTRGYASTPLCSPSLASIITGQYAFEHGITGNDPVVEYEGYKNKLITQTLAENGYRSFQAGKWWVGSAEDAGFDRGMTHGDYKRGGRHVQKRRQTW